MPLDITFTLSDRDLERFKNIIDKARSGDAQSPADIEKAAYKIVDIAMNSDLPDFIAERLLQLKVLLDMMRDEEWQLQEQEKKQIIVALTYFADPIDLIPDHIPGIGFLDDAMFVEIVIRELRAEISAYNKFCDFRNTEEAKLTAEGKDPNDNRLEWIQPKRAELHSKIREFHESADEEDYEFHIL